MGSQIAALSLGQKPLSPTGFAVDEIDALQNIR
jgi:hypothetical protein